jgi:Cyclophilin type peptidyl-prolyl cis-trans isomerase/CLD
MLHQLAMLHDPVVLTSMLALCSGKYTIMGQVIDGMDVLDKMEKLPVGKLTRRTSAFCACISCYPVMYVAHAYLHICGLQVLRIGRHTKPGYRV